jgi:hypothetical protein
MDALKADFETKLVTEKGDAICQKQDIFKGLMWFAYTNFANWHILKLKSTGNHRRKQIEKQSIFVRGLCS